MPITAPQNSQLAGVWALREIAGATWPSGDRTDALTALGFNGVVGYCARIHIDQLSPTNGSFSTTLLESIWSAVGPTGKKMAVRVIGGRYTPAYVFDTLGARSYGASGGNGRAPHACNTDGSPNTIYINWMASVMEDLIAWMKSKGPGRCPLVHWSWFSNQYSEYYHGTEVRSPNTGYDSGQANFIAASNAILSAAYARTDSQICASFGFSGTHVEDVQVGAVNHMNTLGGDWSSRIMFTANGLSQTGFWGATTESTQNSNTGLVLPPAVYNPAAGKRLSHGGQDIQPGNYPVSYRTGQCDLLIGCEGQIWEIYTNDGGTVGAPGKAFSGSNAAGLQQQINRFFATVDTGGPPPPPPPTVTGFTPTSGISGSSVVITGTGFTGVSAVRFNGVAAGFTVNSATNITATVPGSATDGPISVTTTNGTGTSAASFNVTGGPATGSVGRVVETNLARTITPVFADDPPPNPGGTLTPVALPGIAAPGPMWTGWDDKIYVATRPSSAQRPKLFQLTSAGAAQISDGVYESNAIVPLGGSTDVLGRVIVGTQGQGLLVATSETTPPPPPSGDGSPLRVQIAPGNGPLNIVADGDWVDIAQYGQGLMISGGRQHELGTSEAGKATMALRDDAEVFEPSNTAGPFYGSLVPLVPFRIVDDGFPMFYGYVLNWGQTWPQAPVAQNYRVVQLEAADAFAVFSMFELSSYPQAVLSAAPTLYYRFNEAIGVGGGPAAPGAPVIDLVRNYGSRQLDDIIPGQSFDLRVDPDDAILGYTPGPLSTGASAVELVGGATVKPLYQGGLIRSAQDAWFSKSWDFYIYPQSLTDGDGIAAMGEKYGFAQNMTHEQRYAWKITVGDSNNLVLSWTFNGALRSSVGPTDFLTTDGWQHIAITVSTQAVKWYRNGKLVYTGIPPLGSQEVQDVLDVGDIIVGAANIDATTSLGQGFDGRMAHFAAYPTVLGQEQIAANYSARAEEIPEGYAGVQINAILDAIGWPAGQRSISTGSVLMAGFIPSGSALSLLLQIAETSERGLFQMSVDGKALFHSRDDLLLNHNVPLVTFGPSDADGMVPYRRTEIHWDEQDLYNIVKVTMASGESFVAQDALLGQQYGPRTLTINTGMANAEDAANLANELVARYGQPYYRPVSVELPGAKSAAHLAQLRQRATHGDRVTLVSPDGVEIAAQINGRHLERPIDQDWLGSFELVPAEQARIWIVGTSVIGEDNFMGR